MRSVLRLYHAAFSGLSREVWLFCLVLLVNRAGTMVLPFLTLYLTEDRGLGVAAAGRLVSAYGVGAIGGAYIGGWLSDRIGPRGAQQLSLIAAGFVLFAFPLFERPWAIALALLLLSAVAEAFRPAAMAAIAEVAPEQAKARAFALLRLAANLGMAIGPAIGGWLALRGYGWLFVVDGVTCWIAALLLLSRAAARADRKNGGATESSTASAPRVSPWRDGPFLALLLLTVILATVIFQVFTTWPVHLRQAFGMRENAIGLLLAFNAVLIVLFEMVLVHWAERRDRMVLIGFGSFLLCFGLALLPLGSTVAFVALTVAIWTVGEMLSLPLLNVVVADRAAPGMRGRYMGLYAMSFSLAFVIAPVLGAWVYERLGPDAVWVGVGAIGPLLLALALLLRRRLHRPRSSAAKGIAGA